MKTKLLAAAAALAIAALAPAAQAAVWVTQLDYDTTGKIGSVGAVTVTDGDDYAVGNTTDVQVDVLLGAGFITDTGGHYSFAFNLDGDAGNQVSVLSPTGGAISYVYANTWSKQVETCRGPKNNPTCTTETLTDPPPYKMAPFGEFQNAFFLDAPSQGGGNHLMPAAFSFKVHNAAGLTFAGLGATTDSDGKLQLPLGSGLHFESNTTGSVGKGAGAVGPGGWWFAVDTSGADSNCAPTCVVAGRDAVQPPTTTTVPEPSTWALMITGFGAAGAVMRRRRVRPA